MHGVATAEEEMVSIPEAVLTFYDFFVIEDCQERKTYLVANGATGNPEERIREAEYQLTELGYGEEKNDQKDKKRTKGEEISAKKSVFTLILKRKSISRLSMI